jgi:hypothetical protein
MVRGMRASPVNRFYCDSQRTILSAKIAEKAKTFAADFRGWAQMSRRILFAARKLET